MRVEGELPRERVASTLVIAAAIIAADRRESEQSTSYQKPRGKRSSEPPHAPAPRHPQSFPEPPKGQRSVPNGEAVRTTP